MQTTTETGKNGKNGGNKGVATLEGRKFTKDNWEELWLLGLYGVQRRGGATCHEIVELIQKDLNSKVDPRTMSRVLEALRKKEFLAANVEGADRVYSTKKLQFNCPMEIAQVDALLCRLKEDPAGIALAVSIEAEEGGSDSGKDLAYPMDWADYTITVKLITEMRGAYPYAGNPALVEQYKASQFNATFDADKMDPADLPLIFDRGPNGGVLISARAFVGFIEHHLGSLQYVARDKVRRCTPWDKQHFYVQPIEVLPPARVVLVRRPTVSMGGPGDRGGGKGLKWFETLPPGTEITVRFSAPTKNFVSSRDMEAWLRRCLRAPVSSFSPACGRQTGASELIKFECSEPWWQPDKK